MDVTATLQCYGLSPARHTCNLEFGKHFRVSAVQYDHGRGRVERCVRVVEMK